MSERIKIRSLFISDVHIGCKYAQIELLNKFLKKYDPEYLYLVGDIVDFWQLGQKIFWTDEYSFFFRKIIGTIKRETKIFYITGNHDEVLRPFVPETFGNVKLVNEIVHSTLDGRRLLVIHGDYFDQVTKYAKWLYHLGSFGYNAALWLNQKMNKIRKRLGLKYWSLSAMLKRKVKEAASFINNFEQAVVIYCKQKNCDGVICGHIHTPSIKKIDGLDYYNCGDWVESCSAIIENLDGSFVLVYEGH